MVLQVHFWQRPVIHWSSHRRCHCFIIRHIYRPFYRPRSVKIRSKRRSTSFKSPYMYCIPICVRAKTWIWFRYAFRNLRILSFVYHRWTFIVLGLTYWYKISLLIKIRIFKLSNLWFINKIKSNLLLWVLCPSLRT